MTSSNSTKESLLTFIEWSNLVELGFLEVSPRRVLKNSSSALAHMKVTPHIGYEEDAYLLCKFIPSSKKAGLLTVEKIVSFHPVTEKGKRLLEVSTPAEVVKLSEPVFEDTWLDYCQLQLLEAQAFASQQLVELFGVYPNKKGVRKPKIPTKVKKIPEEFFVFPIEESFVKKYLGTSACGYSVTRCRLLNYLEKKDAAKLDELINMYTENFEDLNL